MFNVCVRTYTYKIGSFFRRSFVPGDSNTGLHKRSIYEHNGIVCSQKRALCIATVVFAILFAISLIIAFAGPQNGSVKIPSIREYNKKQNRVSTIPPLYYWFSRFFFFLFLIDCPCAGEKPASVDIEDDKKSSEPLATNGEVWLLLFLLFVFISLDDDIVTSSKTSYRVYFTHILNHEFLELISTLFGLQEKLERHVQSVKYSYWIRRHLYNTTYVVI